MHLTRVRLYPVKSLGGLDVRSARVEPWGLAADRRWAVVDDAGRTVTARERNQMLALTAEPLADGGVLLGSAASDPLRVDVPADAAPVAVGVSRQGTALPAGGEANDWLSTHLGQPVRLVWQPDPTVRAVSGDHGGLDGDRMSLADAGPLLLTTEASLAALNAWTDEGAPELDMLRFRPNVVVDGDEPFAEDEWGFVTLGEVRFRIAGGCDRCMMTGIDPFTLQRGLEPIRTLSKHRRRDGKTWFGVLLVPQNEGEIAVGDAVAIG
ncbi:MOSC domain-containing protein [Agromyces sp. Leaf222]|uniref:MOSC domain-containing protein n=1 Tax=Agromyces sp. Leaf222 TaxID=1735688 RepID=UPI0006F3AA9F|nr:MOSC N-terminal beta barrel domain-containing protein [Agromyces sp. Leaf222]KQM81246.1 sulfurase [Agromyces sp. Leaf222]